MKTVDEFLEESYNFFQARQRRGESYNVTSEKRELKITGKEEKKKEKRKSNLGSLNIILLALCVSKLVSFIKSATISSYFGHQALSNKRPFL